MSEKRFAREIEGHGTESKELNEQEFNPLTKGEKERRKEIRKFH